MVSVVVPAKEWFNSHEVASYYHDVAHQTELPTEFQINEIGEQKIDLRCGPVLRLVGTLEENSASSYRATMLLVTSGEFGDRYYTGLPRVSYQLGPAAPQQNHTQENEAQQQQQQDEVTVQEGVFPGKLLHQEGDYYFWRYDISLQLALVEQKCKYYVDAYYSPEYEFYLPALHQSMNVMFYSCNGFSYNSDATNYKSQLWYDVLRKHAGNAHESPSATAKTAATHYHVMVGGGDQIYSDVIKRDSEPLPKWLETSDWSKRDKIADSSDYMASFNEFYLKHYLNWYGRGFMDGTKSNTWVKTFPKAIATIPSVNIFDDHDIIDGFGSYEDIINASSMFLGIGEMAFKYYLLFQHHTSLNEDPTIEPSWVLGRTQGKYIKHVSRSVYTRLGRKMGLIALDCRTERSLNQVVYQETYDIVFTRLQKEINQSNGEIKHLLVLLGVPIFYPRLVLLESILNNSITKSLTSLLRKLSIGSGVLQEFDGSVDIIDDLNDHWCSDNHKAERNRFVARLQLLAAEHGVRITILGGDVHLAAVGRMRSINDNGVTNDNHHHRHHHYHLHHHHREHVSEVDPLKDPRLMLNLVSSAIVNHPPPTKVGQLLFNCQKKHVFGKEAEEDMVPIFKTDADGVTKREEHHENEFLNKRNWADLIPIENDPLYKPHINKTKFPGPVDKFTKNPLVTENQGSLHYDLPYPVDSDGLAATIHVEKDLTDPNAETQDYEILIPSLTIRTKNLPQTKVKYVTS